MEMNNKGKKKTEQDHAVTDISIYIAALSVNFRPAANPAETTHWFSTDEVLAAIRDIDPSAKISREQVFSALRDAGYDFCNRPGSHGLLLRWMFREKS
jgi:hypothetical protein